MFAVVNSRGRQDLSSLVFLSPNNGSYGSKEVFEGSFCLVVDSNHLRGSGNKIFRLLGFYVTAVTYDDQHQQKVLGDL